MAEALAFNQSTSIFTNTDIEFVITKKSTKPLMIVLCPNYEDRTRAITNKIKEKQKDIHRKIIFLLICLKNKKNNNILLEDLKDTNICKIQEDCNVYDENIEWLEYPENFSTNALNQTIESRLKNSSCKQTDILFDISTMPRSVIFHMCEHIQRYMHYDSVNRIYFSYAQPAEYSRIHYAQDIGILTGLFSGTPLKFDNNQSIHTVIFPSRTGHEGKLLCDSLDISNRSPSCNIYFPINTSEFHNSLELMRANQSLLDRETYNNYFYCTIEDAVKDLDEYFNKEALNIYNYKQQNSEKDRKKLLHQTYIVAPFGSKVFLPIAFFELQTLKKNAPHLIDIEICHVKGFQYTSIYSSGIGKISCFKLEVSNL